MSPFDPYFSSGYKVRRSRAFIAGMTRKAAHDLLLEQSTVEDFQAGQHHEPPFAFKRPRRRRARRRGLMK